MRAKIKLWGKEYLINSINWYNDSDRFSHVTFKDENGELYVIHHNSFEDELDAEQNRNPRSLIHSNLDKTVFWVNE